MQFNSKTKIEKWTKYLNIHFFKENTQTVIRCMKRYLWLLIITEMQIKILVSYHFLSWLSFLKKRRKKRNIGRVWRKWLPNNSGKNVNNRVMVKNSRVAAQKRNKRESCHLWQHEMNLQDTILIENWIFISNKAGRPSEDLRLSLCSPKFNPSVSVPALQ